MSVVVDRFEADEKLRSPDKPEMLGAFLYQIHVGF